MEGVEAKSTIKSKAIRVVSDHYVWPEFERELYSICPQRRCTLQSNGQTKNMSENFLMRKQLSQNSRKRKDKRVIQDNSSSDSLPEEKAKKSKQTRRIVQTNDITPTSKTISDTPATSPVIVIDKSVQRQLEFGTANDVNANQTRNYGKIKAVNNLSIGIESKRPKLEENCVQSQNDSDKNKESLKELFPAGQLIWGKLKGFDWWPGMVVELKSPMDNQVDDVWVKWYGDNKFSKVRKFDLFEINIFTIFGV